jgi:hypothetical protein
MIANVFSWLETFKDQIGLIVQLALLVATFILIIAGFMQALAARAQARAANSQVVAANAQSETARTQLGLSIKTLYANLGSMDAATRPLLQFKTPADKDVIDHPEWEMDCTILNCGLGPALDMEAFCGKNPNEGATGMFGDFLGVGDRMIQRYRLESVRLESLTIRYSSTQGSRYETELSYSRDFGFMQFHRRVKDAFEGINQE